MDIVRPPRISLAQTPTPLQSLDRVSSALGGPRIWVKRDDLTGSHLSGNKVRKLEFVIAQALEEGCDTLITAGGVQSNHCRATALLGAQLGLKVHLLLRGEQEETPDGNLLLDLLAGAETSYYSPREFARQLADRFHEWQLHYTEQGHNAFAIPIGASDGVGAWGYIQCCEELRADFQRAGISPEWIVTASGSGGTQAGLVLGNTIHKLESQVLGFAVCDDEAYFRQKVGEDIEAWSVRYAPAMNSESLSIHTNDRYIGPGYAKAGSEVFDIIRWVAATEGLVLDPVYSGKAFHGLVSEIKKGFFNGVDDVVFIHTGGIFGLFPQRSQIALS